MTCIAYRDRAIASDRQITSETMRYGQMKKIGRAPNGAIGGVAGLATFSQRWLAWFIGGGSEEDMPKPEKIDGGEISGHAMMIFKSGTIRIIDYTGYYDIQDEFFALGSGDYYAFGAMSVGASAEDAVKAAITWCTTCGGLIDVLRLDE